MRLTTTPDRAGNGTEDRPSPLISLAERMPPSRGPSPARRGVRLGSRLALLMAALAVLALARLRPDLPIAREPMSEYVHGPYSWVQVAVFVLVGLGSLSIAWQAQPRRRRRFPSERPFLVAWGIGMLLAAVIDVEDQVLNTEQGAVHNLVVKAAFVALLLAALIERPESPDTARGERAGLIVLLVAMMALTAILERSAGYGAAQRGLGMVALLWVMGYSRRAPAAPDQRRSPP